MNRSFTPVFEDLQTAVHKTLASWGELGGDEEDYLGLLLLVRQKRAELETKHSPLDLRRATNDVLRNAIDELAIKNETESAVLHARFIEGEITRRVAYQLHASPDQVNRWQKAAIRDLTEILLSRELILRKERQQEIEALLPPSPYTQLFGFDAVRDEAAEQVLRTDTAWIVAIVGIGGIGKTSLADAVTRYVLQDLTFEKAIWLRAGGRSQSGKVISPKQSCDLLLNSLFESLWPDAPALAISEQNERIRRELKQKRYLIVLDNLEKEDETAFILEHFWQLAEPSKFLLTSRARPTISRPAYYLSLEELPQSDAANLIRHHAAIINLDDLAQASDDELLFVYELTGGNPLALKLVVSLAAVIPLPQIMEDLSQRRSGPIEDLYRFIYLEAWRSLSQNAQALLQAMPLVAENGALPKQLISISQLDESSFWPAVTELVSRSLLEVRGTVYERRYGIHRLTETFLRTEIINWPAKQ